MGCKERTWSSEKPSQPPLRPAEVPPVLGSHMVGHLLFSVSVCNQAHTVSSNDASTKRHAKLAQDDCQYARTAQARDPLLLPIVYDSGVSCSIGAGSQRSGLLLQSTAWKVACPRELWPADVHAVFFLHLHGQHRRSLQNVRTTA